MISDATDNLRVATFRVGDLLLGIRVEEIREVTKMMPCTPVPHAAVKVSGVTNLRGQVVTVLTLREILGLPPEETKSRARMIFVKPGEEIVAFEVDAVDNVVVSRTSEVEEAPANVSGVEATLITGVIKLENTLVLLLDVGAAVGNCSAETSDSSEAAVAV